MSSSYHLPSLFLCVVQKVFKEVVDEKTGRAERCESGEKEIKIVARAYTPITNDNQKGSVDMVVKVYSAPGREGKMSSHMGTLKIGDTLDLKGPIGHVHYKRNLFEMHGKQRIPVKHVGMICGGTGITPMYQVISTALADPEDKTVFHLIYANQVSKTSRTYTHARVLLCMITCACIHTCMCTRTLWEAGSFRHHATGRT